MMNEALKETNEKIGQYWNNRQRNHVQGTTKFWYQHPQALLHYRDQIIRTSRPIKYKPIYCYLDENFGKYKFERGISIGCGTAQKEMQLVANDLVGSFDLYELSDLVIAEGEKKAKKLGIQDRINFHNENIFESSTRVLEKYDLVHWDNSLHHMFDAPEAIRWSVNALKNGGVLIVDDYMGPSYMQIAEKDRLFADATRQSLEERYLINPSNGLVSNVSPNIPKQKFLDTDPSEMADSGNIIPGLKKHCSGVEIINGGGVLFFLGLRPLFGNFRTDSTEDSELLASLLEMDALYSKVTGSIFHGFACWKKP